MREESKREEATEKEEARERLSIDTGPLTLAPSELKEEILELPPQTKF